SEYAEFHYGDSYFGVPNFPQTLAQRAIAALGDRPRRRALDLGCAAGRARSEIARVFEHVTGVDFAARFINQGVQLIQSGQLRYTLADEGELVSYKSRTLAALGLLDTIDRVEFFQGDACNLKPQLTDYDLVLAANPLDRRDDPARFLDQIHERIGPGGLLVIASPYTWLEEHTPRAAWLGGFKKDAENYTTLDGLKDRLAPHFRLLDGPADVPFVIRETRRKFQHTPSELTIWERLGDYARAAPSPGRAHPLQRPGRAHPLQRRGPRPEASRSGGAAAAGSDFFVQTDAPPAQGARQMGAHRPHGVFLVPRQHGIDDPQMLVHGGNDALGQQPARLL